MTLNIDTTEYPTQYEAFKYNFKSNIFLKEKNMTFQHNNFFLTFIFTL